VGESQINSAIENFVAIPLIIIIGLYMAASAIDPILQLNNPTFRVTFTVAGGIPSLTLFFKKKIEDHKPAKLNEE
jgi:hypothetical protein